GRVDEAHRDVEPAPLAARQRLGLAAPDAPEIEPGQQLLSARPRVGNRHAVEPAMVDQLLTHPRLGLGAAALRDVADPPPHADRLAPGGVPGPARAPPGRA